MPEVGAEVEPRHEVGCITNGKVVQREQAAFDMSKWREHEFIRTNFLYSRITADIHIGPSLDLQQIVLAHNYIHVLLLTVVMQVSL